ncbi:MAG: polysaccharide deacetylase family protein [Acidobacteriota bacterium]
MVNWWGPRAVIEPEIKHRARRPGRAVAAVGAELLHRSRILTILSAVRSRKESASFPFTILLYHRINDDHDPFFPALSVAAFEAQMDHLARRFHVVPLTDLVDRIQRGAPISPRTIVVTFDDGYRDNLLCAHPVVQKFSLPVTLFVATGFVETGKVMWNDQVAWAIKHSSAERFEFETAVGRSVFLLRTVQQRVSALETVLEELKGLDESGKQAWVERIRHELNPNPAEPETLMLDWKDLRTLRKGGWNIGSHTVNHPILTAVKPSIARAELHESKRILEIELEQPVTLLAYPNGKRRDFSDAVKTLARECGYKAAVTTLGGFGNLGIDLFEMGRQSPWEDHLSSFAVKMDWSYLRAPILQRRNSVRQPASRRIETR